MQLKTLEVVERKSGILINMHQNLIISQNDSYEVNLTHGFI